MPDIAITITNLPQIRNAFKIAPVQMVKELDLAIGKTILDIGAEEVREYSSLGIGVITRGLINSVTRGRYQRSLYGEVGPNVTGSPGVNYAVYVHRGTRFMTARPFLANAVKDAELRVDGYFHAAVQNVLDDIGRKV